MNPRIMLHDVQFENDGDIELKLALSPSAAAQLARQDADAEAVLRALLDSAAAAAKLNNAELWFIVEAAQAVTLPESLQEQGQLKVGFQTKWREDILHLVSSQRHRLHEPEQLQINDKQADDERSLSPQGVSLREQVKQQLKLKQLSHHDHSDQIIVIPVAGKQNSNWSELIRIEQDAKLVIFYAVFPFLIPASVRKEVAEVLLNDNYDLMNGAFEMDSEDGELRFRSTLLCPNHLDAASFQQLLTDHQQIMEHYLPILRELLG